MLKVVKVLVGRC